jgi:hypothetical protein
VSKAKAKEKPKMGRPSLYTDELANTICDRIAMDESLVQILMAPGMPDYATVMRWLRDRPDFCANYARAREAQADFQADELRDLGKRALRGEVPADAARVAVDVLKWSAGRRNPKKYGDRQHLEHTGKDGGPIKTEDVGTPESRKADAIALAARLGITLHWPD